MDCIVGFLLLLQMWPWIRFRLGDRGNSLSLTSIEIFYVFIFHNFRCKIEDSPLGGLEPLLSPPFGIKWVTKYLFKYTPCQRGPSHFGDQLEILSDSNINWMSYASYYDDITWVYYAHQNV
jgi:hypothetical protein